MAKQNIEFTVSATKTIWYYILKFLIFIRSHKAFEVANKKTLFIIKVK